jgi:pimeloyl-ACP methyl ester carboxylesterase
LYRLEVAGARPFESDKLDPVSRLRALIVALSFLALFLNTGAAGSATQAGLEWASCGSFQCATLTVPLDYSLPQGRQIDLAVVRQQARRPDERIGSLFVNPGGPGGSAIDFLRAWAPTLAGDIRDRFDIIAFDPRGVGQSTPLECHDNILELAALPPDPQTDAEWQDVFDSSQALADLCAERSDGTLPYLGTENVARDIDQLREALGEDKISYFGYSYGTEIGAVYADLFPDRVRAMVLDGAVDLALSGDQIDLEQALGFETAYDHFLQDCRARSCLDVSEDPEAAVQRLLTTARDSPVPAPRYDRPASEGEIILAIVGSLYSQGSWSMLARGLQQAIDGDATALLRIADNYLGRKADGTYDNSLEMNIAVNCLDHEFTTDPDAVKALAGEFQPLAPHFGAALAQGGVTCGFWHAVPSPLSVPVATGAPPIVVIGTTSDPATPYRWAVGVAGELETGVLLTNHGEGHTAYRSGVSCIDIAVNDYLLTVQPPPQGSSCGTDRFSTPPLDHPALPGVPAPTVQPAPPDVGSPPASGSPSQSPITAGRAVLAIVIVLVLAGGALWLVRRT